MMIKKIMKETTSNALVSSIITVTVTDVSSMCKDEPELDQNPTQLWHRSIPNQFFGIFSDVYRQGPLSLTWLSRAWISIIIHCKVWAEITYPFQTSTVQRLKFGNGYIILSRTLMGVWIRIHAGIKVNPC